MKLGTNYGNHVAEPTSMIWPMEWDTIGLINVTTTELWFMKEQMDNGNYKVGWLRKFQKTSVAGCCNINGVNYIFRARDRTFDTFGDKWTAVINHIEKLEDYDERAEPKHN